MDHEQQNDAKQFNKESSTSAAETPSPRQQANHAGENANDQDKPITDQKPLKFDSGEF